MAPRQNAGSLHQRMRDGACASEPHEPRSKGYGQAAAGEQTLPLFDLKLQAKCLLLCGSGTMRAPVRRWHWGSRERCARGLGRDVRRLKTACSCFGTPIGMRDELQITTFQHGRQGDAAAAGPRCCSCQCGGGGGVGGGAHRGGPAARGIGGGQVPVCCIESRVSSALLFGLSTAYCRQRSAAASAGESRLYFDGDTIGDEGGCGLWTHQPGVVGGVVAGGGLLKIYSEPINTTKK